jgi:aspartyl-tRNA(Asn)/glutamyl-tRNA(Gln) amidotransferase subunit A
MTDVELTKLTLAEAADKIRRREISAIELTQAYLERIEDLNKKLNCYITVTAEIALERARQAEQEVRRGETSD